MLLKLLLSLAASDKPANTPPKKKTKAELSREKDRREYALWEMAEEYDEEDT